MAMGFRVRSLVIVALGLALMFPVTVRAGKLGAVRSEVRGSSNSSSSSSSSGSSSSSSGSSGGWFSGSSTSSHGYHHHGSRSSDVSLHVPTTQARYGRYPYAKERRGYVVRVPGHDDNSPGRLFSGQLSGEGAYAGDGVWRSGVGLQLTFWRLGFDTNLSFYLEQPLRDALYLGSSNLTFALVLRPKLLWRLGGGANYMVDGRTPGQGHREYASGYNVTTSVDVFPFRPIVLSGRFDAGMIFAAPVVSLRGSVGVVLRGFELYGGYEFKTVGNVPLSGPMAGLRAWF